MWRLRNLPLPEENLVCIAGGMWLHRKRPWMLPGPRRVRRAVGWPLVAAGAGVVGWSLAAAGRVELGRPDRLVRTGPYAFSRNPMYVGWALFHLGVGAVGGSAWVVASCPAAAWWIHRQIAREERVLGEAFGSEFARYRARVPRYLPAGRLPRAR